MKKTGLTIKHYKLEEGLQQFKIDGEIRLLIRGAAWLTSANFETTVERLLPNAQLFEDKWFGDIYQEVQIGVSKCLDKDQKKKLLDWLSAELAKEETEQP